MVQQRALRKRLLTYALSLPEAYVDHPWGEDVIKVGKKVFCFLGVAEGTDFGVGLKLPQSGPLALAQTGVTPMGYGLGKAGWVSVRFGESPPPFEMLRDWITESYRAVAPKKAAAKLDAYAAQVSLPASRSDI